MPDGSVTFSTKLDNTQLEKDLNALTKKIEKSEKNIADTKKSIDKAKEAAAKLEQELSESRAKRLPIAQQLGDITSRAGEASLKIKSLKAELEEAKVALDPEHPMGFDLPLEKFMQYQDAVTRLPKEIQEQEKEYEKLNTETMKLISNVSEYDAQIEKSSEELNKQNIVIEHLNFQLSETEQDLIRQKEEAGHLTCQIEEAEKAAGGMGDMMDRAEKKMSGFLARVKKLASRVFAFTLITSALREMRTWLEKSIKTSDAARQSIAQMKGALLTLAQPLVEIIIPAFTLLVNILARVVTAVASLVSALFGKTLKQSRDGAKALWQEANAIDGVGAAAEEAAGSLAGFDEINTINTESAGGVGGNGATEGIAPDFSWMDGMDSMADRLQRIADLVAMIAAGLALWKIRSILPGTLGTIAEKLAGLMLTIGGLLLYWNGLTDAWENGVDWLNLIEMIGGLAAAAAGLYLLLGPIAAGIALVVGGLGMLATGFHDAMKNGWNLQNILLTIAGILAAGLGIALITGSWIPLLIAGIASVLLALTTATGYGEELIAGVRSVLEGFRDFFVGIFTGDIEKAVSGIKKIFDGLGIAVGAVFDGVKDSLLNFLDWLDEKTGGRFHGIIETAKGFVTAFFDGVKQTTQGWLGAMKQIFIGLIQFLSGVFTGNWDLAWEGIQNIFKGAWNSIIGVLEGAVNLIIRGLNWLISQMNKISFEVPEWVPGVGGKKLGVSVPSLPEAKIPRLAQGAVIPPNREFLAVLGDQKSGTNIETPEGLLRQLFREELGDTAALLRDILAAVKAGHIIMVDGTVFGRTAIEKINSVNTAAGKQMLIL